MKIAGWAWLFVWPVFGAVLVGHFKLYRVPRKGAPYGGGDGDTGDGNSVQRLGATTHLARQMLIWSDSDVARISALVIDSTTSSLGKLMLALLWGLTAMLWVLGAVHLAVMLDYLDDNPACHVADTMFAMIVCDDRALISAACAAISGFGTGVLACYTLLMLTTAWTITEVLATLLAAVSYLPSSCVIRIKVGATPGLLIVTTVGFPVCLVSLLWGDASLLLNLPADSYAGSTFAAKEQWTLLFEKVMKLGIGPQVLGISDTSLEQHLNMLDSKDRKTWSPLVASLVRTDETRKKLIGNVELGMVVGMFHKDWVGVEPPAGLTREGDLVVPRYGGKNEKQRAQKLGKAGVSRRLVRVGHSRSLGTSSTSPLVDTNEEILPIFYEEGELEAAGLPPLSLLCVQPFRHARCRIRELERVGYLKSVGWPPLTCEEALLVFFSLLLVCWLIFRGCGYATEAGEPPVWTVALAFGFFHIWPFQRYEYLLVYRALCIKKFITERYEFVRFAWIVFSVVTGIIVVNKVEEKLPLYIILMGYVIAIAEVRVREWKKWEKDSCWRWGVKDGSTCTVVDNAQHEYGHVQEDIARLPYQRGVPVGKYRATVVRKLNTEGQSQEEEAKSQDWAWWDKGRKNQKLRACGRPMAGDVAPAVQTAVQVNDAAPQTRAADNTARATGNTRMGRHRMRFRDHVSEALPRLPV